MWPRGPATPAVVRDGAPHWSPDGREIVFFSERQNGKADLFVMSADGTGRRAVMETPDVDEGAPSWSPDGQRLAFDSDRHGNFEIFTVGVDGRDLRRLTSHPARDLAPAWSPDGTRIAFMSNRDTPGGFDVYVMNADGTGVERLTTAGSSWFPQFSPDGRSIAMHVHRDVHVLDLETRELRRLTTDPDNGMYPTWSADGRLAFMSWRAGRTEIFTMDVHGSNQTRLVSLPPGGAIDPRWSPDGSRIVFLAVPEALPDAPQLSDQPRVIHIVDVASREVRRLSR
jgi:Tol biopolymer transport system component